MKIYATFRTPNQRVAVQIPMALYERTLATLEDTTETISGLLRAGLEKEVALRENQK